MDIIRWGKTIDYQPMRQSVPYHGNLISADENGFSSLMIRTRREMPMTCSHANAVKFGDLRMYVPNPRFTEGCYVQSPTAQTITFAGKYINLSAISRSTGISGSHLSRLFRGKRQASVPRIRKISDALRMRIQEFIDALDVYTKRKKAEERKNRKANIRSTEKWLRRRSLL